MQAAFYLTLTFSAALLGSLLLKFWLATRQVRYVGSHRNHVPPPFRETVSLVAHQRAADYTVAKVRFALLNTAFGTAMLLAWTLLGGLGALNDTLRDLTAARWGDMGYQLTLIAAFVIIGVVLELPFSLYDTFRIEQRFGFNRMTWKLYIADMAKGALLGIVVGLPITALILWLMGAAGRWWWLWAWLSWVGFNLVALIIYPTLIAPLFNKFQPLDDLPLRERVQALMARSGFAAKGLFVMDGSKRSAHANAYFTGLGVAKRVVFFDTLLQKLKPGEVVAVLAHELGHYKHKHVTKRLVTVFAASLIAFALLGWLATQTWFYLGLGVRPSVGTANDGLALLLFMLVTPVFSFFIAPLLASVSRRHEFQADTYACMHADGRDLAAALLKLYEDNASTLTPDPIYARFYYSHPPASERLAALPGAAPF